MPQSADASQSRNTDWRRTLRDRFLISRHAFWWALLTGLLAAFLFSLTPSLVLPVNLKTGYKVKMQTPFADTSQLSELESLESHYAKLTPRITGAVLVNLAWRLNLHPLLPAFLGGIVYLAAGYLVTRQISGEKVWPLLIILLFAGLYTATLSMGSYPDMPRAFDGVALGFSAAALIAYRRYLLFLTLGFLALWADERAALSIGLGITAFALLQRDLDIWKFLKIQGIRLLPLLLLYGVSRALLTHYLGWHTDISGVFFAMTGMLRMIGYALWFPLEGGSLLVLLAIYILWTQRNLQLLLILSGCVALCLLSGLIVWDLSRSGAFWFPMLFICVAIFCHHAPEKPLFPGVFTSQSNALKFLGATAAAVSLLLPNINVVGATIGKTEVSLVAHALDSLVLLLHYLVKTHLM